MVGAESANLRAQPNLINFWCKEKVWLFHWRYVLKKKLSNDLILYLYLSRNSLTAKAELKVNGMGANAQNLLKRYFTD